MDTWSIDLPNWHGQPDPEIPGATVWVHTDYHGQPDLALAVAEGGDNRVSVLSPVLVTPAEIDGEDLGVFPDWDSALEFALSALEIKDGE